MGAVTFDGRSNDPFYTAQKPQCPTLQEGRALVRACGFRSGARGQQEGRRGVCDAEPVLRRSLISVPARGPTSNAPNAPTIAPRQNGSAAAALVQRRTEHAIPP